MGRHVDESTSQTLSNKTLGSDLNAGGYKITNLAAPVNDNDAARKIDVGTVPDNSITSSKLSSYLKQFDYNNFPMNNHRIKISNAGTSISNSTFPIFQTGPLYIYGLIKNYNIGSTMYYVPTSLPAYISDISTQTLNYSDNSSITNIILEYSLTNICYGKTTTPSADTQPVDGNLDTVSPTYTTPSGGAEYEAWRVDLGGSYYLLNIYAKVGIWIVTYPGHNVYYKVQYSNDGSNWTTAITNSTTIASEVGFSTQASVNNYARYIRVVFGVDSGYTAKLKIYEVVAWV